jgi:hypothetical protein
MNWKECEKKWSCIPRHYSNWSDSKSMKRTKYEAYKFYSPLHEHIFPIPKLFKCFWKPASWPAFHPDTNQTVAVDTSRCIANSNAHSTLNMRHNARIWSNKKKMAKQPVALADTLSNKTKTNLFSQPPSLCTKDIWLSIHPRLKESYQMFTWSTVAELIMGQKGIILDIGEHRVFVELQCSKYGIC